MTLIGLSALVWMEQHTVRVMTLSSVWIVMGLVVAAILLLKPRGVMTTVVTVVAAVVLIALAIWRADPTALLSGDWQLVLVGETSLVVLLVQFVSHIDVRLDEASRRMALADAEHDGALLETFDLRHPYLREQMVRSRRYKTPMSVLIVHATDAADESSSVLGGNGRKLVDRAHAVDAVAGRVLRRLRASDRLFRDDVGGRLFLVCPETDSAGAQLLLERIVKALAAAGSGGPAVGKATFPDEALTFEELVGLAEQACESADRESLGEAPGDRVFAQRIATSVATYEEGR